MSQTSLGVVRKRTARLLGGLILATSLGACSAATTDSGDGSANVGSMQDEGYVDGAENTGVSQSAVSAGAANGTVGQPGSTKVGPTGVPVPAASRAALLTQKLGGSHVGHFLVGMGGDGTNTGNDPAYSMGVPFDMHYHYLTGISTEGGWLSWNSNPNFVQLRMRQAKPHGQVPMFTMYGLAAHGDGNLDAMKDGAFVKVYLSDFAVALDSIKSEGGPVILHLEPDFWGYVTQKASNLNAGVDAIPVTMTGNAPDCVGAANNVAGFAQCMLKMARTRAPNAIVGFQASGFGTKVDSAGNTDPSLDVAAEGKKLTVLMKQLGADKADFMSVDGGDRDAGCFENGYVKNGVTICSKKPNRLWDDTNVRLPNFNQFFRWIRSLHDNMDGMPMMVWQIPFGEPGPTPGGPGAWRDNKTKYFLEHIQQMVDAGMFAAAWGCGTNLDQTTATTAFKTRTQTYFVRPMAL